MNELYFEKLAKYTHRLLNLLPIEREIQPLDYAVTKLWGLIKDNRINEVNQIRSLWCYELPFNSNKPEFTGLNTIGMLTDRFTILSIKEWCLRNKNQDHEKADHLFLTQTMDIIKALANCSPGNSAINSKISNIPSEVSATDWEDVFYQLLGINLVLWETQEVLYIKEISSLPAGELRDYIRWFAHGNIERNALIELAEIRFWEKVKTGV